MSLQLVRLQRELTEAALRLAAGATADDLFSALAPAVSSAYGLKRIELRAEGGYERHFGAAQPRIQPIQNMLKFPISVDGRYIGAFEIVTGIATADATLSTAMRQVAALFAIALSGRTAGQVDPRNEEWRALFDEHPAPLIVYEMASAKILAVNGAFCESYGYDAGDLVGLRFTDVCVPDAAYNDLVDADNPVETVRCRHRRRDGTRLDVEVLTRYCMWMGEPACLALINDVTSRTRIERRLVQSEKRLDRVQEIGGVGIFEVDLRTGERYWSRELRRQFGLNENDALPHTAEFDFNHVHEDDRELVKKAYERAIERHETCRVDHRIIQPGGNIVWLQLQAELDFDDEGRPTRAIGTTVDITDRKMAEQQLGFLAHYDPLTGLANRAHAISRLQNTLRLARRNHTYPALIFLDLDHFKTVNDSLGHDFGDQLLIEVGRRLKQATRERDTVARMGGDEFVIIINEANSPQGAENVATRILNVFSQAMRIDGRDIFVTCSLGIAYAPSEGIEVEALLSRADMAMYHAKRSGRNRFSVYQDAMLHETVTRLEVEADLRRALERNEFFLAYQPIVSFDDGQLSGVEALIRWRHSDGVRMPGQFIALAEESDLIHMIGDWALQAACEQAVRWCMHEATPMSVNVSRRQLTDPEFVSRVFAIIKQTGMDPNALQLEVTETALVSDIERSQQSLAALREAGVRIAIDDFGTGYNSLANLRYSVIDALKIDRSFIADIAATPSDIAIAGAVASAGRTLGIRVVAEGVETEEHYDILRSLGCTDGQGYWFSRPIEADAFEKRYIRAASSSRRTAYSA